MSEWDLPTNVEKTTIERAGGGGYVWESGVYDCLVKMVYLDQAKSEAVSFNVILENSDGKEFKEAMYIKSGKEKGNKTYYTKDGKDYPLPGYSVANSLCVAATGETLPTCMAKAEKKMVNIYNYDLKKEVPTERPVVMPVLKASVKVAIHQMLEDKNKKNAAGQYVATGETRSKNECKFFGNAAGLSSEEITAEATEAKAFDAWAKQNTGVVIDKSTKKDEASSAAAIMGGGEAAADTSAGSMFG